MRRVFRRYVAWERRWGGPINHSMAVFEDWLFIVLGPAAVIFGGFCVAWGFGVGFVAVAAGIWMTWAGWSRLIRLARSRVGGED